MPLDAATDRCSSRAEVDGTLENGAMNQGLELLHLAREHVRSRTRTPTYLKHADRFSAAFLGKPLGVAPDCYLSVGTDVTAVIDTCYEELVHQGKSAAPSLRETTRQLQEMVDLSRAARAFPKLFAQLSVPFCSLVDVARAVLAAITIMGHESLSQKMSVQAADEWLTVWQDRVWRHNYQQELHSGLSILPPLSDAARSEVLGVLDIPAAVLQPTSTTFSVGAREYLTAFSDTAAGAVAIIGAVPFADRFSGNEAAALLHFLKGTPEFLNLVNALLRLAQDVTFDDSEPFSALVAAIAAERRGAMVSPLPSRHATLQTAHEKMRREWEAFYAECRQRMRTIVSTLVSQEALHEAITELAEATYQLAQALTSAPHKG
jgi:hypothetical protein